MHDICKRPGSTRTPHILTPMGWNKVYYQNVWARPELTSGVEMYRHQCCVVTKDMRGACCRTLCSISSLSSRSCLCCTVSIVTSSCNLARFPNCTQFRREGRQGEGEGERRGVREKERGEE